MHRTRRLALLSLVPLAALTALVASMSPITSAVANNTGDSLPAVVPVAFAVVAAGLIAACLVYILFIVHIARRNDFTPSDKAMWIVVMFVGGPLGPPIYWLATIRVTNTG
jgi:hypothetical protein